MKRKSSWLRGVLFAGSLVSQIYAKAPFPQAESDLAPDRTLHFGILPNGVRYVIMPNREPLGRVSLRLLVLCGSIDEADGQCGLAHYLEHMAFNGSAHFAPETLVKYFQLMGMRLGADVNASTTFLRTLYQVDLPDSVPAKIAQGLLVFSDYAGGLLLTSKMVDKERPIILAEKRTSDSVQFRQYVAQMRFLLADSIFAKRITIGQKSDIDQASRGQLVDVYDAWYRPERMVVVIVGDIDPATVEAQVVTAFKGLRARGPARPEPDRGHATVPLGLRVLYHYDPEAPLTSVSLNVVAPYLALADSSIVRRSHLVRSLATAMINRRLAELAKKEGAPFLFGNVKIFERYNFCRQASINLDCPPNRWQEGLALEEMELRRALRYGFTSEELREAVADARNRFQQVAQAAPTRLSADLAFAITESILENRVFTSPDDDLARAGALLDVISTDDCLAALRYAFATPGRNVMVMGDAGIEGDAKAVIMRTYQTAQAAPIKPPEAETRLRFAYTNFGPPGGIAVQKHVDDLGLKLMTFANGVRLNLKRTEFEADRIRISIRIGGGQLLQPAGTPGLAFFTNQTFINGGLGKHSADDILRITAGRTVDMDFSVQPDALVFHIMTTRSDLLLALQLCAAYVSDPGYRPEAVWLAIKSFSAVYNQLEHVPQGPLSLDVLQLLASGDFRFGLPSREVEFARTIEEERAWLAPQLASGPVEIAIVGDLKVDEAIGAVANTFGALPSRSPKPGYYLQRLVHFPVKPMAREYTVFTSIPKAIVALYWPTTDIWDIRRTRRFQMLAEVLRDRLRIRIRERMGDAYSVAVSIRLSDTYEDYGYISVSTVVAPEKTEEVEQAILGVASDLSTTGITDEELERAKRPTLTAMRDSLRTNQYWLDTVLASCQEYPIRLDWARTRRADLESITTGDLAALAKSYLGPGRAYKVNVSPEKAAFAARMPPNSGDHGRSD